MKKFKEGDIIRVTSNGCVYEKYAKKFEELGFRNTYYNPAVKNGTFAKIFAINTHEFQPNIILLACISKRGKEFLINSEGVELIF